MLSPCLSYGSTQNCASYLAHTNLSNPWKITQARGSWCILHHQGWYGPLPSPILPHSTLPLPKNTPCPCPETPLPPSPTPAHPGATLTYAGLYGHWHSAGRDQHTLYQCSQLTSHEHAIWHVCDTSKPMQGACAGLIHSLDQTVNVLLSSQQLFTS